MSLAHQVAVGTTSPRIVAARNLRDRFRTKRGGEEDVRSSALAADVKHYELGSFDSGIRDDGDADRSAIVEPWPDGQTEGRNIKLRRVRHQTYGRDKIGVLHARTAQPG